MRYLIGTSYCDSLGFSLTFSEESGPHLTNNFITVQKKVLHNTRQERDKMSLDIPDEFDVTYERVEGIPVFKNYLDGKWEYISEGLREISSPYNGSLIAKVPKTNSEVVERALGSADKNRRKIRDVPAIERIELFEKAANILRINEDIFVETLISEAGKPRHNAKGEVNATINRLEMVAEEARKIFGEYVPGDWSEDTMQKMALVIREPIGVVLAISPFNYPLFITSAKVIPALLAGNSVVVKLPSADPVSFILFTRILEMAGLPSGALNVVTAGGKVIDEFIDDSRIGAITFTGSTEVGRSISNKAAMKKLHLELGGNGAAIVLEGADLELAAEKVVHGSLNFSGQRCDAISRVIVQDSIAGDFVERVTGIAESKKAGDPSDDETVVGPLIDSEALAHVDELVGDSVQRGAKITTGGKMDGGIYLPTVIDMVPKDARIMREETFGPVIPIHHVPDVESAIEVANDTNYGLDSCVFTNDIYDAWKVAKKLEDGEITINDSPSHGVGYFPFGGSKESGIGREGIGYSIDEMTRLKTIVYNLAPAKLGKKRRIYVI